MAFQSYQLRIDETRRAFRSRRRLDTDHTAESFDSGISSLDTRLDSRQTKTRRRVQVDDVLWCTVFTLTIWYFELPISLLTDQRVDWFYLSCSILCQLSFILIGLYLSARIAKNRPADEWPEIYPKLFSFAIVMFASSCVLFCMATWSLWNLWTIYIVFVTFMFITVVISFV